MLSEIGGAVTHAVESVSAVTQQMGAKASAATATTVQSQPDTPSGVRRI